MDQWQKRYLEVDRSIGVFDGQTQVGGASIFTMRLTVPEARQVPLGRGQLGQHAARRIVGAAG
jgi:hypothetical protein